MNVLPINEFVCLGQGAFRTSRNNRTRWKSRTKGNIHKHSSGFVLSSVSSDLLIQTFIWVYLLMLFTLSDFHLHWLIMKIIWFDFSIYHFFLSLGPRRKSWRPWTSRRSRREGRINSTSTHFPWFFSLRCTKQPLLNLLLWNENQRLFHNLSLRRNRMSVHLF